MMLSVFTPSGDSVGSTIRHRSLLLRLSQRLQDRPFEKTLECDDLTALITTPNADADIIKSLEKMGLDVVLAR